MDEEVAQFLAITGADDERIARGYLEISGNDVEQAIQLYFESPELASSFNTAVPEPASASGTNLNRRRPAGREDASGVITIDSDEEDVEMSQTDNDQDDAVAAVARAAQEEDDAAMARRLQEEMYGSGPAGEEDIRAPMSRTTETLVAPSPGGWGLDDTGGDAILEQLRRRRQPTRQTNNPFSQSVWDEPRAPGVGAPPIPMASRPGGPATGTRTQRLADMFRPPNDLMSHLPWDDARQEGKDEKKWIMINVQDMSDFNCQVLNRDHWKDENIKSLLKEHFVFLQYDKDSINAQEYLGFYFQAYENPDSYPYVAIVDPRTGEQVKLWSGAPFPPKGEFYSDLVEFLDRYSLAANSKNPVAKSKPKTTKVDFDRLTEEQQLEMALQNSLDANGSSSKPSEQDPDELTKSVGDISQSKGKEAEVSPPSPSSTSPFSLISSSQPHSEPEHNPATTTRIQFRHPAGRVIRRFAVTDPVRRIYEWLKAEPLEGKEGIIFELKAQPGGDLIDKLETSIEEAGLKQGTVMIEFIEDE